MRKSFQGVEQAATAPIEDMIVRECAAIDRGGAQAVGVFGTHPVVDALRGVIGAAGDARFEIDDAGDRPHAIEFVQRRAPDVSGIERRAELDRWQLGKLHIVHCRLYIVFVKDGIARILQHLVDAAPGHDVAAEEQPYGSLPRLGDA